MLFHNYGFLLIGLLLPIIGFAQAPKRVMTHQDVAIWQSINRDQISNDGRWISYELTSEVGDPELVVFDGVNKSEWRYTRGTRAQINSENTFLVFSIKPGKEEMKKMQRKGKSKSELPGDTLGILNLSDMTLKKVAHIKSYTMPKKWGDWLFYQTKKSDADTLFTQKQNTQNGYHLNVVQFSKDTSFLIPFIQSFTTAENGPAMAFVAHASADLEQGVYYWNPQMAPRLALGDVPEVEQLSLDRNGEQMAFLGNQDTIDHRVIPYTLYHWDLTKDEASAVASDNDSFLPETWRVSDYGRVYFSKNGQRLFFGTAPQPILKDTALLDDEIVQVEVWTYKDDRLYPEQKVQANRDKRKTYLAMYDLPTKKIQQLGNLDRPTISLGDEGDAPFALVQNDTPYRIRVSWEGGPGARDVYLLDLSTGKMTEIAKELRGYPALSPEGKYVYWFDYKASNWYGYNIPAQKELQLTDNTTVSFADETDDHPDLPRPYGQAGWTTNDDFFMAYDRYDIWQIDPNGKIKAYNLTNGRAEKSVSRYVRVDPEERAIEEVNPLLFHVFNETSKDEGYHQFNIHTGVKDILVMEPYRYDRRPQKAKNAERWLLTRQTFDVFPDLLYGSSLSAVQKISAANPQQEEIRWGDVTLYDFVSLDGAPLQGLLVTPDDFDATKKYPLIVNFYERSTDGLHTHRTPQFHRSTINYAYYVSKGYVIFNPDVPYKIGYPGESAFHAVMGGVQALLREGFIDEKRIGVQGHSWGGYQIAHLLTKTNLFACAESGAPVVNMVSAYGGIRWGSGMSRMFQYEHTQSRIGGTLWEKPLLYLENSPIFSANKIETPVLILHNDEDGAVPWYQGIEFFVAMRRLGKPAWMLNYNGEPHWPLKPQNRRDFQTRMAQFFDYYLMGSAMPEWMETGVPAIEKGINQRLNLIEDNQH